MRALTIDADGWARLLVGDRPVKRRPVRRQDMPKAWVFNGAIYLFRASLLSDPDDPSLYGDRVAAYVMAAPYGQQHRRSRRLGECRAFAGPIALTHL